MYPITNAVKALFEAEQRQVLRITGTDANNNSISITEADIMENGFGIDRCCCTGTKLEIGTAIAAELTLKLDNRQGQFNGIAFEGAELFVEVGIADWTQTTPTVTYIPMGYFTPDQQPRNSSVISINALDRMTKFDQEADGASFTFPYTVSALVSRVCSLCGVTLNTDLTTLPNYDLSIAAIPSIQQTITYRNLIQWCAGIMGTSAWMGWDGQLRFSWYSNSTGYDANPSNRFTSDRAENDIEITGVTYTNTQDVTIVSGTADYALDLTGNYLAANGVATILPAINNVVNGFTYRPFTASVITAPYLWPMDAVTFTDADNTSHNTVLTNVHYSLNGITEIAGNGETAQTNSRVAPSGVTNAQAFLVERAMESFDQEEVFNRLTNDGAAQGVYLVNGQLYINASYIQAGTLSANYIKGGTLKLGGANDGNGVLNVYDQNDNLVGTISKFGLYLPTSDGYIGIRYQYGATSYCPFLYNSSSNNKHVLMESGVLVVGEGYYTNLPPVASPSVEIGTRGIAIDSLQETPDGVDIKGYGNIYTGSGQYLQIGDTESILKSNELSFENDTNGTWFDLKEGDLTYSGNMSIGGNASIAGSLSAGSYSLVNGSFSTGSLAAGAFYTESITFTAQADTNYIIVAEPSVVGFVCSVRDKTTSGATVVVYNLRTSAYTANVKWALIKLT